MKTYFISDQHFNHVKITEFERTQFTSIEKHNEYIIQEHNAVVQEEDLVYILGDLGSDFYTQPNVKDLVSRLNGRKILVLGNHDYRTKPKMYESWGIFEEVHRFPFFISSRIAVSHEPIEVGSDIINIHGHLHNADLDLPNYVNVSAHMCGYKPLSLENIEKKLMAIPKKGSKFLQEWYAPNYKFNKRIIETRTSKDLVFTDEGKLDVARSIKLRKKLGIM